MIHELKPTPDDLLATIDLIRSAIEAGEVVAFAGVTIAPDDEITAWTGETRPVTKLRVLGAIAGLLHSYFDGIGEE